MNQNRGAVVHAANDLRVDDLPEAAPVQVVVDIAFGGVCGSDLHYVHQGGVGDFMLREPMVLGHEVVGRVRTVGAGVTAARGEAVVPGLAVAVAPATPCGRCPECTSGRANICRQATYLGSAARFPHVLGGFAQRIAVRADQLVPLPDGLDLRRAAVAEPLAVGLHALNRAGDVAGRRLLVTGAGPIGCLLVAAARHRGAAEIIVTDLTDEALAVATAVGATTVLRAGISLVPVLERTLGEATAAREARMKITRIETIPFAIPYAKPLRFASGEVTTAEHVLVRVHTDAGLTGTAEAPPRPFTYGETTASIVGVIDGIFAPALTGLSPLAREAAHERLDRTIGNPAAKSAIDMALWDLIGQSLGVPVTDLLGGYTDRMRVSHMLGFDEPAAMVDQAERMRAVHGITTFKVKVGRRPPARDVAVCRALRDHFGDAVDLYLDGNRGWTAAESARVLAELADVGLSFVEELCPADDVLSRRRLVANCPVPFFADESVPTPADVTRELLGGSATGISIKTARTGFTVSQRVLNLCTGLGVDVVMGNQIDGQIGSLCSAAFGAAFAASARRPGELSNFLDMTDDLLTEPLVIEAGELRVRQAPGLGIVVDEAKLAHYRLN